MFCPKCGAQVADDARFCPVCGAGLTPVQPAETPVQSAAEPVYTEAAPVYDDAAKTGAAKSAMIMAIVALALSELGIPGIILSAIAGKKVKAYQAQYGELTGMAKVANILSKIALPVSIVMTVFWVVYMIVGIIAASGAIAYSSRYRYY